MSEECTDAAKTWFVYIVVCADDSLYTGITKDIPKRVAEHNTSPKGAKYTRARRPVSLVYQEQFSSRSSAAKREYRIKSLSPQAKKRLIGRAPAPGRTPGTIT